MLPELRFTSPPELYIPVPPAPVFIVPLLSTACPYIPTEFSPTVTVPLFVILSVAFV